MPVVQRESQLSDQQGSGFSKTKAHPFWGKALKMCVPGVVSMADTMLLSQVTTRTTADTMLLSQVTTTADTMQLSQATSSADAMPLGQVTRFVGSVAAPLILSRCDGFTQIARSQLVNDTRLSIEQRRVAYSNVLEWKPQPKGELPVSGFPHHLDHGGYLSEADTP